MFLPYINDIMKNINSSLQLFADDCLLYKVVTSYTNLAVQNNYIDLVKDTYNLNLLNDLPWIVYMLNKFYMILGFGITKMTPRNLTVISIT